MTAALVCFNLLVNAAISLVACIALAHGACKLLRIERGQLRALVLATPLFKVAYEVARGVPEGAFFWAKLGGARQELGSFQLGLGFELPVVPVIDFSLGALFRGRTYPQSAADLLAAGLSKRVAPELPVVLGALLFALALFGVGRFAFEALHGARARRALLRAAQLRETRALGRRSVRVFVSDGWQGVPFAGGLLRPWLYIPAHVERALGAQEREAVIAHELAHIAHHDLLLLSAARLLSQALFFVPGARWLTRAIQAECELGADQRAIESVPALSLASALVRVAELCQRREQVAAQLAFLRRGPGLRERVEILIATQTSAPARRLRQSLMRWALAALAIAVLLRAVVFSNP